MTASLQLLRMGVAASLRFPIPPGAVLALESRSLSHLSDGTPVGTWPDLSGTGHHAVQATTSKRPLVKSAGMLPVVEFDGVDLQLDPSLVLGFSWTILYVSIPLVDYGAALQDGKSVLRTGTVGGLAYTGYIGAGEFRAKWLLRYGSGSVGLNSTGTPLTVGTPYASGVAIDPTGYTGYHQRVVTQNVAKAEALGPTPLVIGFSAKQQLAVLNAWPRRLTTLEYQQAYDYHRAWLARYGVMLP